MESGGNMQNQSSASTFSQFAQLPPELRRIIWLFAAQIPRTIEVFQSSVYIDKLRRMFNMWGKIYIKFAGHATPLCFPPLENHAPLHSRFSRRLISTSTKPASVLLLLNRKQCMPTWIWKSFITGIFLGRTVSRISKTFSWPNTHPSIVWDWIRDGAMMICWSGLTTIEMTLWRGPQKCRP
jgi:hypothetical protein